MVNSARRTATAEKNRLALEELDKMLRDQLAAGKNAEEKLMVDVDKDKGFKVLVVEKLRKGRLIGEYQVRWENCHFCSIYRLLP